MNFRFHKISEGATSSDPPSNPNNGLLKIEVPHWASLVEIFDDSFNSVSKQNFIQPDQDSVSGFSTQASLRPGIYLIKVTLGSKTQEAWVPVQTGRITYVDALAWNELQFTSAIPVQNPGLDDQKSTEFAQLEAAEEYSKKKTWTDSNGNSSLFLFLRTTDEASSTSSRSDEQTAGLQLLTCTGRPIPEFSTFKKVEKGKGWIAFNADLPAGGYILRQGRQGVRLRYQVIYLCPNWQTQIFIKSRGLSNPTLKSMSLSMSRKAEGFRRDDESDTAAEAISKGLRFNSNLKRLFGNTRIRQNLDVLIDEKIGNPWLGILAAHAILRLNMELAAETSDPTADENFSDLKEYLAICKNKILPFLTNQIPMHPDVQALILTDDGPSNYSFVFPPSLWISLRLVQSHSSKYSETIPKDCLTDCIRDGLMFDSPWTSWRYLTRSPSALWDSGIDLEPRLRPQTSKSIAIKKPEVRTPRLESLLAGDGRVFESSRSSQPVNLNDLTVKKLAMELTAQYEKGGNVQEIPIETTADTTSKIGQILEQITPKEVSAIYDLPLSRTEHEFETLRRKINSQGDPESNLMFSSPETGTDSASVYAQNAILDVAARPGGSKATLSIIDIEKQFNNLSIVRIDEIAAKIRTCAERLWVARSGTVDLTTQSKPEGQSASAFDTEMPHVPELARRLSKMAIRLMGIFDRLLSSSTFIALTDSQQKIFEKNDAFLQLLVPRELGVKSTTGLIDHVADHQKKWEHALAPLSLGASEISHPLEPKNYVQFNVRRSIVKDEKRSVLYAHINVIRTTNYLEIPSLVLEKVNSRMPDLTLYSSLVTYGSIEDRRKYSSLLDDVIDHVEDLAPGGLIS